ncbi:hypothetical protein KBB27_04115 [Patescibacteria group bacterium]|nr:hypothetical protein [Patescibacteria group bacterium]
MREDVRRSSERRLVSGRRTLPRVRERSLANPSRLGELRRRLLRRHGRSRGGTRLGSTGRGGPTPGSGGA